MELHLWDVYGSETLKIKSKSKIGNCIRRKIKDQNAFHTKYAKKKYIRINKK